MTGIENGPRDRAWNVKPIGYVVKRVDNALNDYVGRVLGEFGVERAHWQLMRTVHERPGTLLPAFVESARVFYDEPRVLGLVDDLTGRGWLVRDDDEMRLTAEGEDRFAAMATRQDATLDQMLVGLTIDDYLTVVRLLETMADNLDGASAADGGAGH